MNPEIERTCRKLRKEKRLRNLGEGNYRPIELNSEPELDLNMGDNNPGMDLEQRQVNNANNNIAPQPNPQRPALRSIRDVNQEESYATMDNLQNAYPNFDFEFDIKGPILNNLPKFHGLTGENPYSHLTNLRMHCRTMKPRAISVENCMWKIFHLTLEGKARTWYNNLPRFSTDAYS